MLAVVLAACGDDDDTSERSTATGEGAGAEQATTTAVQSTDRASDECVGPPRVELVSGAVRAQMAMVFYGESSATCSLNVDGEAMFNPTSGR